MLEGKAGVWTRVIMVGLFAAAAGCSPQRSRTDGDAGGEDGGGSYDASIADGGSSDGGGTDGAVFLDGALPDGTVGPDPCAPIPSVTYETSPTAGPVTDRPAADHPDINLKIRGWEPTGGFLGLVDIAGPTDTAAPKLYALFADHRVPVFVQNHAVYGWDWNNMVRGPLVTDPEVTLTSMAVAQGEIVHLPASGYDIGGGLQARVLLADDDSITLKYTSEDDVVWGYTLHVVGICVEPSLKALYDSTNAAGRTVLPALYGEQPFGRARSAAIVVCIRDTGSFMDPRSRKDWW